MTVAIVVALQNFFPTPASYGASGIPRQSVEITDTSFGLGTTIYAVDMLSPSFGYGVAASTSQKRDEYHLVQTTNLGTTWTNVGALPLAPSAGYGPDNPLTLIFTTHEVGYIKSSDGPVYVTRDAGVQWEKVLTPGIWPTVALVGSTLGVVSEVCRGALPAYGPARCPSYLSRFHVGATTPFSSHVIPAGGHSPWRGAILLSGTTSSNFVVVEGEINGPGYGPYSLLSTSDAGQSWQTIANPCSHNTVNQLITVSKTRWLLYCFLGGGMMQGTSQLSLSTNQGATWRQVAFASEMHGSLNMGIGDVDYQMVLSQNHRILYGADDGAAGGIRRSTNGGRTWTQAKVSIESGGAPEYLSTFGPTGAIGGALGGPLFRTVNGTRWTALPGLPAGKDDGLAQCSVDKGTNAKAHYSYVQNHQWEYVVTFINHSPHGCYLNGDPSVQATLGTDRQAVGTRSILGNGPGTLPYIKLKPNGGEASLLLYVSTNITGPASECGRSAIDSVTLHFSIPTTFSVPVGRHFICSLSSFAVNGSDVAAGPYGVTTKTTN
jgi:photosystem II stability/assembly factor-like uncharacterized protein